MATNYAPAAVDEAAWAAPTTPSALIVAASELTICICPLSLVAHQRVERDSKSPTGDLVIVSLLRRCCRGFTELHGLNGV